MTERMVLANRSLISRNIERHSVAQWHKNIHSIFEDTAIEFIQFQK
jgi:hypothetical protein